MIDPYNITNYNMSISELEEVLLFWICAAGKKATTVARSLELVLTAITHDRMSPFEAIKDNHFMGPPLADVLKTFGIGCYNHKARTMKELAFSNINLKTCAPEELEKIYGIGFKTARCFIIHSRKGARYAGLDTHILKFLRSKGHEVPKSTPNNRTKYLELEQLFLTYADKSDKSLAEFDLGIWRNYSK